ncbi:hypothetical protein POM88_054861 [Heracleum sosnowskyi]|uniref:Uncharacterized protein n=1 Tax=Heracleum sosnowskyi TaxID=360622 RepID=A0AAD8GLL0_9APIA|nr:hypothetical protein POM88_054861 [Heracleum sosnowskyi]
MVHTEESLQTQWELFKGNNEDNAPNKIIESRSGGGHSKSWKSSQACFETVRSINCPDLIAAAVHGKNISEEESRQIYCVVLIVNSVVSSASVLRIIRNEC